MYTHIIFSRKTGGPYLRADLCFAVPAGEEKEVEVVLAGDEFFQQCHAESVKVLVPKGVKRVGSATKLGNAKEGYTSVVTMALEGSSLLQPTVVFNGNYLFYITYFIIFNYIHLLKVCLEVLS